MGTPPVQSEASSVLRLVPPFPAVAQRILALVSHEEVSMSGVEAQVKLDPMFSAELLRFANSAIFRVRQEVRSIPHALMLVGVDRVKTMALLVVLTRLIRVAIRMEPLRKVWIHSLVTALIAEECGHAFRTPRATAYTFGLLHNLGTLGLMAAEPERYAGLMEGSHRDGFELLAAERARFGIDHCAAGAILAREWSFPEELATAIASHHEEPHENERDSNNLVRIAWRLSDTLGYAAYPPARVWTFEELTEIVPRTETGWLHQEPELVATEIEARLVEAPIY